MRPFFSLSLLLISLFYGTANAQNVIDYDSLTSLPGNFSFTIENNSIDGAEIIAGDFNGDGLADMAYSASDASLSGIVKIKYGTQNFETSTGTTSVIFTNPISPLIEFGWELGAGDLNNDGIDDLLLGLPEYDESRGRLYVIYGKNSWPGSTIDLSTISATEGFYVNGLVPAPVFGPNSGSILGKGYAIGDLNGDNMNDLFVTAPIGTHNSDKYNERGYLIFGEVIQNKLTIDLDTLSASSGVVFATGMPGDEGGVAGIGFEALFRDINGDGKEELIFSEHNTPGFGSMYIVFQNNTLPDTVKLNNLDGLGFRIKAGQRNRGFGEVFDFGDLNGDGLTDIVTSSISYSPINSDSDVGGIYIIFGRPGRFGGDNFLYEDILPSDSNPTYGIFIEGEKDGENIGKFIKVADFNNDGIDDLIFTGGITTKISHLHSQNKLRVLLGAFWEQPNILDLKDPSPMFPLIEIAIDNDKFDAGFSITAEDFNNDQKIDIAFGTVSLDAMDEEVHSVQLLTNYDFDLKIPAGVIYFNGGNGTPEDPYLLSNSNHLQNVRGFMDSDFKLTEDIILQNDTNVGWVPFGYARDDYYMTGDTTSFSGCFDGNGKTISNLEMNARDKTTGFFAYVSGCVKNLNFEDVTITHTALDELPDSIKNLPPQQLQLEIPRFVGTVAGNVAETGLLENVSVQNASILEGSVGSIAGLNFGTIIQAHGEGRIYDAFQAGGVVAVNYGTINQSSFEGSFDDIFGAVGGIVAVNGEGAITESYSKSVVDSTDIFGGIAAQYTYGLIENNYTEFEIKSQVTTGGIIGRFGNGGENSGIKDPLSIKNNYASGTLAVKTDEVEFYRGIIGLAFISSEDSNELDLRVTSNYWNKELFGEEDNLIFGYRVSNADRTNAEMTQELTFTSWDFGSIWTIDEGSSFPYLKNNPPTTKPGTGMVTSNELIDTPLQVQLHQNYPNPFNPSTSIAFELNKTTSVRLEIFDLLGRSVGILINNQPKQAGVHTVNFNGSTLSSGVYMYQLTTTSGENLMKRFTLIK